MFHVRSRVARKARMFHVPCSGDVSAEWECGKEYLDERLQNTVSNV